MATASTNQDMQGCILDCQNCHRVCLDTLQYCLEMGGPHAEASHIQTLLDCAEICATSVTFMLRGSSLHRRTCGVCAEVCGRCADDCESFGEDEKIQACAEMCRRCAASCQRMATPPQWVRRAA